MIDLVRFIKSLTPPSYEDTLKVIERKRKEREAKGENFRRAIKALEDRLSELREKNKPEEITSCLDNDDYLARKLEATSINQQKN